MQTLYSVNKTFSDRLFRVPDYQRGYAWDEQQWQDFVEDLELLAPDKNHFMGTLILHERTDIPAIVDEEGQSYTTYDLVDGQQRLTTIVLFLDAIRREMEELDGLDKLGQALSRTYVVVRKLNDGQRMPKLTLNADTHGFFYDVVLMQRSIAGPAIRSHERLAEAKAYFADYLAEKRAELADQYPEWLKKLYLKVTQSLTLMVYALKSETDAGVVFETMNNRGKELTELEKVKNYLLYLASKLDLPADHGLPDQINETWTHVFQRLMAADLSDLRNEDQLLRAHWLMAYDCDPKKWEGSRSIKSRFYLREYRGRHRRLLEDLSTYLHSLRNATIAYCDIFNPTHSNAFNALEADQALRKPIVSVAEKFARLGAPVTFLPLLMAVRLRAPHDGQAYLEAIELCEKFVFRVYRWLGRRAYTGQSWMFRLGYELFHSYDVRSALKNLRNAILHYCPDRRFKAQFEQQDMDWYQWWGLKYFLYEYEQHLADLAGQDVRMPWEMLAQKKDTIEHILPQTIGESGYWAERFAPEQHEAYLHDIGNLSLTFDNSRLGNKPFPEKKGAPDKSGCYASSMLFVERQLANYKDWTEQEIIQRRQEIIAWATERWHVEPAQASEKAVSIASNQEDDDDKSLIQEIQYVLTRRFIPYGQLSVYHALYRAGDQWVSLSALAQVIRDGDTRSVGGVLGALGVRINSTGRFKREKPGIELLFELDSRDGEWYYRMRPEMRDAIQGLPGLCEAVNWPLDKIKEKYRQEWWSDEPAQREQFRR